jgi:hypothetical protein
MIVKSLSLLGVILALSVEPTSAITGKFLIILKSTSIPPKQSKFYRLKLIEFVNFTFKSYTIEVDNGINIDYVFLIFNSFNC